MEPSPRYSHYSAAVGGQLCVVGGCTEDPPRVERASVYCFNQCRETWQTRATTGIPPPGIYGGACTATGHHLYVYGGDDGSCYHDSFHQLDMDTLEWSQLPSGPMRKSRCSMVSYEDKLILFGGLGIPSGLTQSGAQYQACSYYDGYEFTNELHSFSLKEKEGEPPPPSSC